MSTLQKTLHNAVIRILRPLIRVLLRHGISHAEFSDLAKMVYVDVSEKDFQIKGRKQSVARICVLTGLHRKDVNKIREKLESDSMEVEQLGRAARVISGWLKDEDFQSDGVAKSLPLEGENSFSELVKRYSGDMPVRAIFDELQQGGCVKKNDDKSIELISDAYIPHHSDEKLLQILGISTADLLNTLDFNLNKPEDKDSRLQLVVDYKDIPSSKISDFKNYSEKEVFILLTQFNQWLSDNGADESSEEELHRVGFGLYYFEGDIDVIKGCNDEK
ncbi:MAG: hypothetical protein HRU20_06025 [Pseudomonadales bacterium]|nr:hypothetical protein [Pseudomonadales bacterium]